MNGNFHFMSFDIAIRMAKKVRKMKLFVDSRMRFDYAISWIIICESGYCECHFIVFSRKYCCFLYFLR